MNRGINSKIIACLAGLVLVPLFGTLSNAINVFTDKGGDIHIQGSVDVSSYKLYLPNDTLTAYEEVQGVEIKSNQPIRSQIENKYQDLISNYKFNNIVYKNLDLTSSYKTLDEFPSSDLYLGYVNYFVKGSEDTSFKEIAFDETSNTYHGEFAIKGLDIYAYEKLFTKEEVQINSYLNTRIKDGLYNLELDLKNNSFNASKIFYFEPNTNWRSANATFEVESWVKNEGFNTINKPILVNNLYKFEIPGFHDQFRISRKSPDGKESWGTPGNDFYIDLNSNYSSTKIKFHQFEDPNQWENFKEDENNYWTTL